MLPCGLLTFICAQLQEVQAAVLGDGAPPHPPAQKKGGSSRAPRSRLVVTLRNTQHSVMQQLGQLRSRLSRAQRRGVVLRHKVCGRHVHGGHETCRWRRCRQSWSTPRSDRRNLQPSTEGIVHRDALPLRIYMFCSVGHVSQYRIGCPGRSRVPARRSRSCRSCRHRRQVCSNKPKSTRCTATRLQSRSMHCRAGLRCA